MNFVKTKYCAACLGLGILLVGGFAHAQSLRDSLFHEADAVLEAAKTKKAYVLAPEAFRKGYALYKEAEEDLKDGKNLAGIQRDLGKSMEYLEQSLESSKLGEVTFAEVLKARDDAEKAGGRDHDKKMWLQAEERFITAATELEDGDVKAAKRLGAQAEELYRNVELAAIKGHYLNETRATLAKAQQMKVYKFAPKTFEKAKQLFDQAERALTQNRYDIDQPRDLARQAKYEASHAIYLAKRLSAVDDDQISEEELILDYEKPLLHIAGAANIVAELDRGHEIPTTEIIRYIEKLQTDNRQLQQDLQEMEAKLGNLASERQALKQREDRRKQAERIERMFGHDEATVLRRGNDIILSLTGLSFGVGRANIDAENFAFLSKVQKAIDIFPGSGLVVEGHTDSFGSDASNLTLSQKRATSVRQYLLANMQLAPAKVSAVGYGESRPVANNETPEGRRKNRRIDIVIKPGG